jgi:hypothetical protein
LYDGGNRVVFNGILAELGHILYAHRVGLIRNHVDYTIDYFKSGFDQSTMYAVVEGGSDRDAIEKIIHESDY